MFYDNFLVLCTQRAVTPSAVMRSIGLNKSSASYWKKGSIPSTETLQKLADYFNVTVDYLLSGTYEVNSTHLALGVHIYQNTSLYGVNLSVLDELPENSYDVRYRDKHLIVAVDKDSAVSGDDLEELISEYRYPTIAFGSELEKIFKLESKRLGIPEKDLKMAYLNRKSDGSRLTLNHENISFYFDSIYSKDRNPENRILSAFQKLNLSGQKKAVERVEELTEIPRYQATEVPQSPPAPTEGKDPTPPPEGAEGPQEGE